MDEDVYCIDSSSLMELQRRYPRRRFPGVWQKLEGLIRAVRLIAPREVLKEILQGDDELARWAKRHRGMFKPVDAEQARAVAEVLAHCDSLIDPLSERPQADPFVIALARTGGDPGGGRSLFRPRHIAVTEEGRNHPRKIPQVCAHFGIECIRLLDLFDREGWKFK